LKKIILMTLLLSTFNVKAQLICEAGDDPSLFECNAPEAEIKPNGCQAQEAPGNSALTAINDELQQKACEESDPWKGMSSEEKKLKLKELDKLCKKEAKAYKRSVFKSLFKKGKFGQALQVAFKKKSKIMSGKLDKNKISADVANMSDEQLKEFINAEIDKLEAQAKPGEQSHTVPYNITINNGKGINCKVTAKEFPEKPKHVTPECVGCEPLDIMSSFTNDCSYMVNKDLPEKVVFDEILKIKPSEKKQYCQPDNMDKISDKGNNDLTKINDLAGKICNQIRSGEEPHFTVETTRNLYADKTPQLAYKRGVFVQKYISWHLSKNCKDVEYDKGFDSIIEIKQPAYGSGEKNFDGWKEGDYGPSPYAKTDSEIQLEKERFAKNLVREQSVIDKEIADLKKQIAEVAKKIKTYDFGKKESDLRKSYNSAKDQLTNLSKYNKDFVEEKEAFLTSLGNEALSNYSLNDELEDQKALLEKRLAIAEDRQKSFAAKSAEKKKLLDEFYAAGPNQNHAEWDVKLFNSFKMARITAQPAPSPDVSIGELESFDPQIATKMEKLLALQTYTCNLKPITTKKTSLEGILKFPLKVATILTLPVLAVGAGAGVIALTPINTTINVFCDGCSEPGGTLPRFFAIGDIGQLDLSKSSRKAAWKETKGFIKNYINWGGVLKVNKKKHLSKHSLDKHHPGWDKLDAAGQDQVIEKFLKAHAPEDLAVDSGENISPNLACNSSSIPKYQNSQSNSKKKPSKPAGGSEQ
jgi:hypothetical protein